ncbi:hypothetical protein FC50_GL001590 [Lacticaseibacillus pantheris DSM 15945 = JCM 12539 = NBRC 106106]|uniref:Prenylated flavin chaperone LpdD-like domain-containing protein n=1 Tax=Lacticaseibacillus pantheris DSM 15945 = JCM 12539 = NBRC 106106 TaxID=1423783 RepID=A0A0R1U2E4_9LACO|nr:hypothetical protein [Lacticaseibacillus pantheris]KRL85427.1 hypothetical protein FC50_GL001590 [Lacticaseibacillus pantheris DSM 15945 = JCM 12539 = NBRC 106106]
MTKVGESITFSVTMEDYTIYAVVERQSQDLLIQLIGGDVWHYGVVTAVSKDTEPQDINMPSRPGHVHQERVLTHALASVIRPVLQSNAFIVSGMHVNSITTAQMRVATKMARTLGEEIRDWVVAHPAAKLVETFAPSHHRNVGE